MPARDYKKGEKGKGRRLFFFLSLKLAGGAGSIAKASWDLL